MLRVLTVDDIKTLIRKITIEKFFTLLIDKLESCYARWHEFEKIPRVASHFNQGVIELMPIWDKDFYSFKYVNGHPANPLQNKQTVVAMGVLADVASGYPLLISEMTVLTALRTAATSALAAKYLAKAKSQVFAIIGTGAQSEFQVLAHKTVFPLSTVKYFDTDAKAMQKFAHNLRKIELDFQAGGDIESTIAAADIITTATATKQQLHILKDAWIQAGVMINGIGGDCPGKTELDPAILQRSKVVVEFIPQSELEGEIQNTSSAQVYAELWELVSQEKSGRTDEKEIFVFDSVGFALEDYAILRLVHTLAEEFHVGHMLDMIPEIKDPKNLFGVLV